MAICNLCGNTAYRIVLDTYEYLNHDTMELMIQVFKPMNLCPQHRRESYHGTEDERRNQDRAIN